MNRGLDATDVLLSAAAAQTDKELHAARLAAINLPPAAPGQPALAAAWFPGPVVGGSTLLGRPDDVSRRTLAARLGVITRRHRAALAAAPDDIDDEGNVTLDVLAGLALAAVLFGVLLGLAWLVVLAPALWPVLLVAAGAVAFSVVTRRTT